jgi:TolB-like protein
VFKELTDLKSAGVHIWYDEGIEAGREWRDEIAKAISNAAVLIYFVTPNSVSSENCRNEVNFAADEQTPIVTVYLEEAELTGGLRLTLSNRQAIHRLQLKPEEYQAKLLACLNSFLHGNSSTVAPLMTPPPPRKQSRWRQPRIFLGLGVVLVPVLFWCTIWLQSVFDDQPAALAAPQKQQARLRSVAVLPFQNLSQNPNHEAIADGIALDLVNGLAKIHELRVASGTSSFAFKDQYQDVTEIGRHLRVDTVLEGSIRVVDDTARVTAQLSLVEDGYQLWSERYDLTFSNVLQLQDDVTAEILDSVRLHLIEKAAMESGEVTLGAYDLYLVARDNMRARTEGSLLLAKSQFEESIALDPEYAPAWSDLARTIILLSDLQYGDMPFVEAKQLAGDKLERAFLLEPNLASAHATQGFMLRNEGKQMEALSSFHRAIAADPNNAYAHFMISEVLADSGNFGASLAALEEAYALDNRHPIIHYRLVQYYLATLNREGLAQLIRPDQALLLEALWDFRLGRDAAGVQKATEYLTLEETGFAGVHLRMELARRYYYRLANIDMAQQAVSEADAFAGRVYFQALEYPEVAYQLLRQVPDDYHGRFSRFLLARSEILTERYESCLATTNYKSPEQTPIQGQIYLGLPGNELTLAFYQAFCLQQLERVDEAMALQGELKRYHELAIEQGEPPGYYRLLARLEMLDGNYDRALNLLEQALDNVALDWTDIANPWYDPVRDTSRFAAIQTRLYRHLNEQRLALGWEPIPEP